MKAYIIKYKHPRTKKIKTIVEIGESYTHAKAKFKSYNPNIEILAIKIRRENIN